MPDAPTFRQYRFCQDPSGQAFELSRSDEEVECLAFDSAIQRFVSFHVLTSNIKDRAVFRETALEAQSLASPYLAPVMHAGEDEETPFYITRLVDGPTLAGYLGNLGAVEPYMVGLVVKQIGDLLKGMEDWTALLPPLEGRSFRVVEVEEGRLRLLLTSYRLSPELPDGVQGTVTEEDAGRAEARLQEALSVETEKSSAPSRITGSELKKQVEALLGAPRPVALKIFDRLRKSITTNVGDPSSQPVGSAYRPGRLLIRETPGAAVLTRRFSPDHEIAPSPGVKALSYAFQMRSLETGGRKLSVQVFPAPELLPEGVLSRLQISSEEAANDDHHRLLATDIWDLDGCPAVGEPLANGFDLETYLARRTPLQPKEALEVMQGVHAAIEDHATTRTAPARLLPRDVSVEFERPVSSAERDKYLLQPLGGLPAFRLRVRLHPSMDALTDGWSYCPRVDPATASGSTSEKTKMRAVWTSDLFVCLAFRLLGLGQMPTENQVLSAGFPEPLQELLIDTLPSRFKPGGQISQSLFLDRLEKALQPKQRQSGFSLEALRPLGQHQPTGTDGSSPVASTGVGDSLIQPSEGSSESDAIGFAQALFQSSETTEESPPAPGPLGPPPEGFPQVDLGRPAAEIMAAQNRRSRNRIFFWLLLLGILAVVGYGFHRDRGLLPAEPNPPKSLNEIEGFEPKEASRYQGGEVETQPEPASIMATDEPTAQDLADVVPAQVADPLKTLLPPVPTPGDPGLRLNDEPAPRRATDLLRPKPAPLSGVETTVEE